MLGLVGIVFGFLIELEKQLSFLINNFGRVTLNFSFGTNQQFIYAARGSWYMAALAIEHSSVAIVEFYVVMVEDLAMVFPLRTCRPPIPWALMG